MHLLPKQLLGSGCNKLRVNNDHESMACSISVKHILHNTTESNTLQGYVTPVMDSVKGYLD